MIIGRWGRLHEKSLKEMMPEAHAEMKRDGTLNKYLHQMSEMAEDLYGSILARNPMPTTEHDFLKRVRLEAQRRDLANEIVTRELILVQPPAEEEEEEELNPQE